MWAAFLRLVSYHVFVFFRSTTVTRNSLKQEQRKFFPSTLNMCLLYRVTSIWSLFHSMLSRKCKVNFQDGQSFLIFKIGLSNTFSFLIYFCPALYYGSLSKYTVSTSTYNPFDIRSAMLSNVPFIAFLR